MNLVKIAKDCFLPTDIIESIVPIGTASVRRQVKYLEEKNACIDLSFSNARRTVVFLRNKTCYITSLAPETIADRYTKS